MNNLAKLSTTGGILSALLVATPALTQNQQPSPRVPSTPPDLTLNVQRQKGTCPKTVGLWTLAQPYKDGGGADFTVIADTTAIADPAKLISSSKKFAEFRAPLKKNFASCVGRTTLKEGSQFREYSFRFQNKNVIFRVQLPPDTPSKPSGIAYKNVVSSRPAVRWQLAD